MRQPTRTVIPSFTSPFKAGSIFLIGLLLMGAELGPGELFLQEARSYRAEGRRNQQGGNLRGAIAAYQRAIQADPIYADAYNDLGVVLESSGDLAGAEAAYQKALELKPGLSGVHSNLALLYERQGRLKEAAEHWTRRVQGGSLKDPWVQKARQKLVQHQYSVPETLEETAKPQPEERRLQKQSSIEKPKIGKLKIDRPDKEAQELAKEMAREKVLAEKERTREALLKKQEEARRKAKEDARQKVEARKARVVPVPAPAVEERAQARRIAMELALEKAKGSGSKAVAQELSQEKQKSRQQAIQELMRRAALAMREGRYGEAVVHYQQALLLEPEHPEAVQGLKRAQTALARSKSQL